MSKENEMIVYNNNNLESEVVESIFNQNRRELTDLERNFLKKDFTNLKTEIEIKTKELEEEQNIDKKEQIKKDFDLLMLDKVVYEEMIETDNQLKSNNDKQENSLVEVLNDEVVTTSLQVADFFGKRHKNVIKKIKQIIENMENLVGFKSRPQDFYIETTYLDKQNKKRPMYIMNRDGFTKLAMGFTGQKADEFQWLYIEAFNQMEQQLKNQNSVTKNINNPVEKAIYLAKESRKNQILDKINQNIISTHEKTIEEQKPKVDFCEQILQSKNLVKVTIIANDYGINARKMNSLLKKLGVQYKQGSLWVLKDNYLGKGYMKTETVKGGYVNSKWTQEGRLFIYNFLKDYDIYPEIEKPSKEKIDKILNEK